MEEMLVRVMTEMSKTIMDSVKEIVNETRTAFTSCMKQHQEVVQAEVFALKAENEDLKRRVEAVEKTLQQQRYTNDDLLNQIISNRYCNMQLEQHNFKNDAVIVTNSDTPPTLTAPHTKRPPNKDKKGNYYHNITFQNLNDKIEVLKSKKETKLKVFPVLCPSRKLLLEKARQAVYTGKFKSAYTYKDEVYIEQQDGTRTRVDTGYDLRRLIR